jgi:hypothetical protein
MTDYELRQRYKTNPLVMLLIVVPNRLRQYVRDLVSYIKYLKLKNNRETFGALKGKHRGERCFIIGNGPSLRVQDLEALKDAGFISFASNRIYGVYANTDWRPDYYGIIDYQVIEEIKGDLNDVIQQSSLSFYPFRKRKLLQDFNRVVLLPLFESKKPFAFGKTTVFISDNPETGLCVKPSISMIQIQMAMYMEFSEIYLLGMDNHYVPTGSNRDNYADFIKPMDKKVMVNPFRSEEMDIVFTMCKNRAFERGIKIMNATRGGKLEIFDRIDFDDLIAKYTS